MFGVFGGPRGLNPATMMPYTWAPPTPTIAKPVAPSTQPTSYVNYRTLPSLGNPLANLQIPQIPQGTSSGFATNTKKPSWDMQGYTAPSETPLQQALKMLAKMNFAPTTPAVVKAPVAPTNLIKK